MVDQIYGGSPLYNRGDIFVMIRYVKGVGRLLDKSKIIPKSRVFWRHGTLREALFGVCLSF